MNKPSTRSAGRPQQLQLAQPFSLQAEQAIVGALLSDPLEAHQELSGRLSPTHFYDPFCRAVYEKALELCGGGGAVDAVVLAGRLEGVLEMTQEAIYSRLEEIFNAYPQVVNLQGWAKLIIDKSVERRMAHTGEILMQAAHAQNLTSDEKIAAANKAIAEIDADIGGDGPVSLLEALVQTVAIVEENSKNGGGVTGVPTGYDEIDEMTCGMGAGDFIVIGARPAMGKTAYVQGVAKYISSLVPAPQRQGVLHFSLEMLAAQMGMRWLAIRYGIPLAHLKSGRISPGDARLMQQALTDAPDIPYHIEDTGSIVVEQIAAIARRKQREWQAAGKKLGLVVIDYLQLINPTPGTGINKNEQVSHISRALKLLAMEMGLPVVGLSQLSRNLESRQDKRPIMSDLRDSGGIEQDADVIKFLYRDEVYNKNSPDRGTAEVIIAKQRNGPPGTVRLAYHAPTTQFLNLAGQPGAGTPAT